MVDLFLAGMETTSSSLLWSFLYLLHFPDCQKKIHKEIDQIVGRNRLPSLNDRGNMHYVNAFLLESMRFASFVPTAVFHHTESDIKLREYVIPKGNFRPFSKSYKKSAEVFRSSRMAWHMVWCMDRWH